MNTQVLNQSLGGYLSANPLIMVLIIWILVWKALALWSSARRGQKIWFIAMLVVNTAGLLEITYLAYYYFQGKKTETKI